MIDYFAFDTIRRSDVAYTWASRDHRNVVRFHKSREAAARRSHRIVAVRIATAADRAAVRAVKAADAARRSESQADRDARWNAVAARYAATA